jgi:hypothetical protein
MKEYGNILQSVKWEETFWMALIRYFRSLKVLESLIGHALMVGSASVSAAFGQPLFVEIRSRSLEKVSTFLHGCRKCIPEEWIIDSRTMPKLEFPESFRGKIVICGTTGIPLKTSEFLFHSYLNLEPPTGYTGTLSPKDPLRNRPSILVVDLDTDSSELVKKFEESCAELDSRPSLDPEIQPAYLKAGLRRIREKKHHVNFDTGFLEKHFSDCSLPEKDVVIRAYSVVAHLSHELLRFDANGSLIDPLFSQEAASMTCAMTYRIAPWLLETYLKRRAPMAEYAPKEIEVINALRGLHESQGDKDGFMVKEIGDLSAIPQSSLYRYLVKLEERAVVEVIPGETHKDAGLYRLREEAFTSHDLSLPTWEDYQKAPNQDASPEDGALQVSGPTSDTTKKGPGRPKGSTNKAKADPIELSNSQMNVGPEVDSDKEPELVHNEDVDSVGDENAPLENLTPESDGMIVSPLPHDVGAKDDLENRQTPHNAPQAF